MKPIKTIFDIESQGKGIDLMTRRIGDASNVKPQQYNSVFLFSTLTGLGPNKVQKALHIIKANEVQPVDKERIMPLFDSLRELSYRHSQHIDPFLYNAFLTWAYV